MPDLNRLIYVSRAVSGADVDLWALNSILTAAERNNRRHGLTGLLLAHDGAFCQVREGTREALDGLMTILERDPRHEALRIVCDHPVAERLFSRWGMAQVVVTPELQRELEDVDVAAVGCAAALALLQQAAERMAAEA